MEKLELPKIQEDIFNLLKGQTYIEAKEILTDALETLEVMAKVL